MKKIILSITLAAMMLLCGCGADLSSAAVNTEPQASSTPETTPQASATKASEVTASPEVTAGPVVTPAPEVYGKADLNPELTEFLLAQMQNNRDTNTFEGFTFESTIADVLKKVESDQLSNGIVSGNIEWLGYPTVVKCTFGLSTDHKPLLTGMDFIICPDPEESDKVIKKNILAKLKKGLGSYQEEYGRYIWRKGGLYTSFEPYSDQYGLPFIMMQRIGDHGYPRTPGIFPYKIGMDIHKVCAGLTPCALPGGGGVLTNCLVWKDGDSEITVQFREDASGIIRFADAYYLTHFDYMEPNECVGYLEWLADKLEGAMGKAKGRGYDILVADNNGGHKWSREVTGKYLTAQEVLNSDNKQFRFVEYWEGVNVVVNYGEHPSVQLHYGEDYLRSTVKK